VVAAVAGLAGDAPVLVTGFRCTATSYPTFLDDLAALGGRWEPAGG
jgi:5-enolpyruvylshikimate-3-phosphate synthase